MEFSSMRRGGSVARRTLAALVCLVASGGTVATADEWWNPADQAGSDSVLVSPESTPSQGSFDGMLSDQYSAAPVRPIDQDQDGLSPGPDAGVVDPDLEESEELDDDAGRRLRRVGRSSRRSRWKGEQQIVGRQRFEQVDHENQRSCSRRCLGL